MALRRERSSRRVRPTHGAAAVGLLGVPFDANSSHLRGAAQAPAAIRKVLGRDSGNPYSERGIEVWPSETSLDLGDLRVPALAGSVRPIDRIDRGVGEALSVVPRLMLLGGDHAVSYPAVRAAAAVHGAISLVHFDAHPDMYDDYEGNRYSHASPMARILEEGLVRRLVQLGIRSHTPEQAACARRYGVESYGATASTWPSLRFREPVYVSFDLDVLDPAFAPGVSHPEPGGPSVRQVLDALASIRAPGIVMADFVELNPRRDRSGASAVVAAKVVRELIALMKVGP